MPRRQSHRGRAGRPAPSSLEHQVKSKRARTSTKPDVNDTGVDPCFPSHGLSSTNTQHTEPLTPILVPSTGCLLPTCHTESNGLMNLQNTLPPQPVCVPPACTAPTCEPYGLNAGLNQYTASLLPGNVVASHGLNVNTSTPTSVPPAADMGTSYSAQGAMYESSPTSQGQIFISLNGIDISKLTDDSTVKVIEGEDVTLDCFSDISESHFIWKRDNKMVSIGHSIEILRTRVEDEGHYRCIASFSDNTTNGIIEEEQSVFVQILYPPSYPFVDIPTSVLKGEELALACEVGASPEPTYQWRQHAENGPLLSRDKVYHRTVESSYAVYCNIQNRMISTIGDSVTGYISRKIYINVHEKAFISYIYPARYVETNEGEDVLLKCTVGGSPAPEVWWSKSGDDSFNWPGGRFLSQNIQTSFAGNYVCNTKNTVVAANKTTYTIHRTEVIHVRVHGNFTSHSQEEIQCNKCLEQCSKETSTSLDTTIFRNTFSSNTDSAINSPSSSKAVTFNCSTEETLKSLEDSEADAKHDKTLIGLGVAAGTGWFVSVLLFLLNIYISINKKENLRNMEICGSGIVQDSPNPSSRRDQTEVESAYVSNVRLTDNTYTDLTTYDRINFSRNNSAMMRDTDSVSTVTSVVTYLEPTPNFAQI